eukprot:TRINITY_DN625_c0_g1_i3.p1 TRINITY_DN625_c0_g1~~TRINITY_DN625_c0_g1_i3.p1  ORF type:complete len:188 (+),score=49.08 TRINITY_DN625_c0_g1_i3:67-630(+)
MCIRDSFQGWHIMKIFYDYFSSEDELISDSYNIVPLEEFNNVIGEVEARFMTKGEENIDIGCGNAFDQPAGEEQKNDDNKVVVIDVLDSFGYQESPFSKKDYQTYIKGYMKKLLEKITASEPAKVDNFKEGAKKFVMWVQANFDKLTFYTPQSYECENMIILSYFKNGEDKPPVFLYFLDGFRVVKM